MAEVLIVDDDFDSRVILETLVKTLNLQTDIAETAAQALTFIHPPAAAYRLILSDLALPGNMDGLELIRLIRADPRFVTTICLAITAFDFPYLRNHALQSGFNAYYIKPIDPPALLADLRTLLA